MTAEANRNSEADNSAELRTDIERLFTEQFCDVNVSNHDRPFPFIATQWQTYTPREIPQEAKDILLDDYAVRGGNLVIELARTKIIRDRFGSRAIATDSVQCSLVDYPYSGGPGEKVVFTYFADLQATDVPYVERFARFVRTCLEHATPPTADD